MEVVDERLRRFLYVGNATNKILWVNHGKMGQTSNISICSVSYFKLRFIISLGDVSSGKDVENPIDFVCSNYLNMPCLRIGTFTPVF